MSSTKMATPRSGDWSPDTCAHLPDLIRMNYFQGQLLTARDFRTEQTYVREKLKLLNRCLHGYGVLCGLEICPVPPDEECPPRDQTARERLEREIRELEAELEQLKAEGGDEEARKRLEAALEEKRRQLEQLGPGGADQTSPSAVVLVKCGVALDCCGNEIVLKSPCRVDLLSLLTPDECSRVDRERSATVYLSICYAECGFESTRPLKLDSCGATRGCESTRIREAWKLHASLERPPEDDRCELCCEPCTECCVLLAAISLRAGAPVLEEDIDHGVRRRFGLYEATVITGISWVHGATYSWDQARTILGTGDPAGGLELRFSRPVRIETLKPGVIDLWRLQGGRGVSGVITHMEGDYVGLSGDYTDRIRYRDQTGERLQNGDRVLIIVRGSFILDRCCRPVASAHIGGRIPLIGGAPGEPREPAGQTDDYTEPDREPQEHPEDECAHPPGAYGPWTTGQGPTFESWFYISG